MNKAVLSSLSLLGLSSLSAVADEEIRIAQRGYPAQPGTFQVNVPAGQRVDLEAEALVDGQAVAELTSALQWHVACPDARLPCAPEAFTVTEGGRGRSFQVPLEGGFQEIQLVVSGTDGANATFDLHVGSDQAAPASQTESLPGATAAYPHYQSGFHRPSLTDSAAPADEPAPRRRGSRFSLAP